MQRTRSKGRETSGDSGRPSRLLAELLTLAHNPPPQHLVVFPGLHMTLTNLLFFKGLLHLLEVCQESYVGTNLREAGAQASPTFSVLGGPRQGLD